MTQLQIAGLYIGLNLLILPILMFRVGQVRIETKTGLGDGGSEPLLKRIRAHANFTETTPFALIGLLALASFSAPVILMHTLGGGFTAGRLLHAHGMAQEKGNGKGRTIGAVLSLLTFVIMGVFLLYKAFVG